MKKKLTVAQLNWSPKLKRSSNSGFKKEKRERKKTSQSVFVG